jgi:hypothetical protein
MNADVRFSPPRMRGIAFHSLSLLIILIGVGLMVGSASEDLSGLTSVILLIASIFLAAFFPILAYRLYALIQSEYRISRDGLYIRWGLRQVQLPHDQILDNARAADIEHMPALPRWRWFGSVLGLVQDPDLGKIEYLASQAADLVLIGTMERTYIISPDNANQFIAKLRDESERGSLEAGQFISIEPSSVFSQAWAEKHLRSILIAGGISSLLLFVLAGFLIQGRASIVFGFDAVAGSREVVTAAQLYLLPALNLAFYLGNFLMGLLLFREKQGSFLTRFVWTSSLVSAILFGAAIMFIVGNS